MDWHCNAYRTSDNDVVTRSTDQKTKRWFEMVPDRSDSTPRIATLLTLAGLTVLSRCPVAALNTVHLVDSQALIKF